jgi:hypothetical protein
MQIYEELKTQKIFIKVRISVGGSIFLTKDSTILNPSAFSD